MGKNLPGIWFGSTLITVGTGLLTTLDYTSNMCVFFSLGELLYGTQWFKCRTRAFSSGRRNRCWLFIPDPGGGTSSSNASEGHGSCNERLPVPSVSDHFSFVQFDRDDQVFSTLGGAVGLAIGETVIASVLPRKLAVIPNIDSLGLGDNITVLNDSINMVHLIPVCRYVVHPLSAPANNNEPIQDVTLRNAVLHAWARSIATIWIVLTALAGVALVLTLFLREYSMDRKTVYGADVKNVGASENGMSTRETSEESSDKSPV